MCARERSVRTESVGCMSLGARPWVMIEKREPSRNDGGRSIVETCRRTEGKACPSRMTGQGRGVVNWKHGPWRWYVRVTSPNGEDSEWKRYNLVYT